MKLATLQAGQFVETGGYYAKGDAGAARYLIKAAQAADEKGDHTLANGTVAVLQVGAINVKHFGATGDASTDDTAAIQAALDVAGDIYFPRGTYMIDAVTKMLPRSDSKLTLDELAVLKVITNSSQAYAVLEMDNLVSNITVTGGTISGDRETHDFSGGGTHEQGHGINILESRDITIDNVLITRMTGDCIHCSGNTSQGEKGKNIKIINNTLERARRNNVSLVVCKHVLIQGNIIRLSGDNPDDVLDLGTAPREGLDLEGGSMPDHNVINGNLFYDNGTFHASTQAADLDLFKCSHTTVTSNIMNRMSINDMSFCVIANNSCAIMRKETTITPPTVIGVGGVLGEGVMYQIVTVGLTDFTTIGAANNNVGTRFVVLGENIKMQTGDGVQRVNSHNLIDGNIVTASISGADWPDNTRIINNTIGVKGITNGNRVLNLDGFDFEVAGNILHGDLRVQPYDITNRLKPFTTGLFENNTFDSASFFGVPEALDNIIYKGNTVLKSIFASGGSVIDNFFDSTDYTAAGGVVTSPCEVSTVANPTLIKGNTILNHSGIRAAIWLRSSAKAVDNTVINNAASKGLYIDNTEVGNSAVNNSIEMATNAKGIELKSAVDGSIVMCNTITSGVTLGTAIDTSLGTNSIVKGNRTTTGAFTTDATDTVADNL